MCDVTKWSEQLLDDAQKHCDNSLKHYLNEKREERIYDTLPLQTLVDARKSSHDKKLKDLEGKLKTVVSVVKLSFFFNHGCDVVSLDHDPDIRDALEVYKGQILEELTL